MILFGSKLWNHKLSVSNFSVRLVADNLLRSLPVSLNHRLSHCLDFITDCTHLRHIRLRYGHCSLAISVNSRWKLNIRLVCNFSHFENGFSVLTDVCFLRNVSKFGIADNISVLRNMFTAWFLQSAKCIVKTCHWLESVNLGTVYGNHSVLAAAVCTVVKSRFIERFL